MPKSFVIVESPAKARTIARFLGKDFVVESSLGHIRDLPRSAADVPSTAKGKPWARLGVDVEHGFKPLYIIPREKKDQVTRLKRLMEDASELYLATDEDREGESIAWHLLEVLHPDVPVRRMVFHEITRPAIERALAQPRELDRHLVEAQETRRLLDRLYGYETSPVLWKKIASGLSAGRVQSVATRIIVDRERERMRFRPAEYWDLEGSLAAREAGSNFTATLVAVNGTRLAIGKDFNEQGEVARGDVLVLDAAHAQALKEGLQGAELTVSAVDRKPYRRRPAAPFMTSTLQQEAGRKLRMSAAAAMRTAQSLYEAGYITYMRTDSTTLSDTALSAARSLITERFGAEYLPEAPRLYTRKVKNAQEAHEAIRPAGDTFREPAEVAREVSPAEARLYELIWQRTVASQMNDAVGETVSVRITGRAVGGEEVEFTTSGTTITFPGYQRLYVEGEDEAGKEPERRVPPLHEGEALGVRELEARRHTTSPPARYTEASLVKRLEELGVGRPSTYAATLERIQDVGYVWKKGTALVPSFTAFAVVNLLERHFPDLVDYSFTARMEDELDEIARGQEESQPWLNRFYFGTEGLPGLQKMVNERIGEIDAIHVSTIPIGRDAEGRDIVVRVGKYGPYLLRGEDRAKLPDDVVPDELTVERAVELLEAPSGERELGTDPETGLPVIARAGRFGPYVQLGKLEEVGKEKLRTTSLFKSMSLDTVTLEQALELLKLPRVVGVDPSTGEEVTAHPGRYGPYLKKGKETRSLDAEEKLLTVTLDEAQALFAQPKQRRGRGQAAPPLRELGTDPVSGKPVVAREGRFGPYVTDGETNATLRKGDTVEGLTPERAYELLQDRRAKGPPAKKTARKRAAPAAKKGARKKAAKKGTEQAEAPEEHGESPAP
ncbi:MAG TPA: type I DNA topoisomerase [Myxococcaceae bacterium]|nr:type I DNA topoisomerase [Myxococcaceae bacterium]